MSSVTDPKDKDSRLLALSYELNLIHDRAEIKNAYGFVRYLLYILAVDNDGDDLEFGLNLLFCLRGI
jgi:hypothetical protein